MHERDSLHGFDRNSLRGASAAFLGVFTELRSQTDVSSQRSDSLEGGRGESVAADLARKCGSIDVRARIVESREDYPRSDLKSRSLYVSSTADPVSLTTPSTPVSAEAIPVSAVAVSPRW